jgi:iron complex outermembrane receptor protein
MPDPVRALGAVVGLSLVVSGLAAQQPTPDLGDLDIEQLTQIKVTSVARRPEALGQAPAAIFVVTGEEIRRAGASTLPEALRLAPGLQVARVGSRDWAISSRGFNERSSNKLLVLVDGRAVYNPIFAGVYWDIQDVPLAEVERIEVILGPGATLWGSNAVNGVINITTSSARDTPGGTVEVMAGTLTRFAPYVRQTFRLGEDAALRLYGAYRRLEPTDLADGSEASDDWNLGQGGGRLDAKLSEEDDLTILGTVYGGGGGQPFQLPIPTPPYSALFEEDTEVSGGHILGRWGRRFTPANDISLQAYFDRSVRNEPAFFGRMRVDVLDVDLQHHAQIGRRQDVVWGVGYRRSSDEITGAYTIAFDPPSRVYHLVTGFVQDDIALTPVAWRLTLGTKLEHNSFTGWEVQPGARLRWLPSSRHTLWTSVSRAVRIPSRVDVDLDEVGGIQPGPPPVRVDAVGNEDFESEELIAYELGYRATPARALAVDVALYYNDYDRLRTFDPLPPTFEDGFVVVPLTLGNNATGRTLGGTVALSWQPRRRLRLDASYTYLDMDVDTLPGVQGATSDTRPDFNPTHEATLRGSLAVRSDVELGTMLRYTSEIFRVPDYFQGDVRVAWRPRTGLELALTGKDLFSPRHLEFASPSFSPEIRYIPRRLLVQLRWDY